MQRLIDSYKQSGDLHHAYFFIGNKDDIFLSLKNFLENEVGVVMSGNPDFVSIKFDTLNIESARIISESQERKDFNGKKKFFVIQTDFITEEAQNSLLKVLEEPTKGTHFFIISPQDVLLPTLRSRMQIFFLNEKNDIKEKFLNLKISERLDRVKEITEAISDEEATKQDAVNLLNEIESELYALGVEKNSKALEVCEQTRASLYDRGAPTKMILENLVLSI